LSDPQVLAAVGRDIIFRCPAKLWSDAFVQSGIQSVYRYTYGAVFPDLQPFLNAGAFHASELTILFGTFNCSTATAAEAELSHTLQTAFGNFAKDPANASPAPNWPAYEPDSPGITVAPTLAKIAYRGNLHLDDFIEVVQPNSMVSVRNPHVKRIYSSLVVSFVNKQDGPCSVWDQFLDFRP